MKNKLIVFGLSALIAAFPMAMLPKAHAFPLDGHPGVHCQLDSGFWFLKGSRRTICDMPRQADGSWTRLREFWTPAHQVPLSCFSSGGTYSSFTNCSGGYWQDRTSNGVEDYPVNDGNVLPDEPGWLSS